MSNGIYYLPTSNKIVLLTYVQVYEDIYKERFIICTWNDEFGQFKKTLIRNFKPFKRIGTL